MAKTNEETKKAQATETQPGAAPAQNSTAPENFAGSATAVGTHTDSQEGIKQLMNEYSKAWHTAESGSADTVGTKEWYHAQNQALAGLLGGSVGFDAGTGTWSGAAAVPEPTSKLPAQAQQAPDRASAPDMKGLLDAWKDATGQRVNNQIDYGVSKATLELERALKDAQAGFKEQQETIARDEMQSRDNSALYAEARGDKGGIGQEQYNSIMNTAAQNRLAVQQAQTKMATDTQRQIADLRAQGEFEKADAILATAQDYLSKLISLEQWAAEYNLSVDQFNESVRQWEMEFETALQQYNDSLELSIADLTGEFRGAPTLEAQSIRNSQLADIGQTLLSYGVNLTPEQLTAMGLTAEQAQQLIMTAQMERAAGSGTGAGTGAPTAYSDQQIYDALYAAGYDGGVNSFNSVVAYLINNFGMSKTTAEVYANAYADRDYARRLAPDAEANTYENVRKNVINLAVNNYSGEAIAQYLDSRLNAGGDGGVISEYEYELLANLAASILSDAHGGR